MGRRVNTDDERRMNQIRYGGVSRKTGNTLGGPFAENRGRRSADSLRSQWDGSPFEDGEIYNWNNRDASWREYENKITERSNKRFGGSQLDHGVSHFGKGPKGYKRDDKSIYEDVCSALELSPSVDASEIEVKVKDGVVYFSGTVNDRGTKKLAEYEIENISGVVDVQNLLKFGNKNKDLH